MGRILHIEGEGWTGVYMLRDRERHSGCAHAISSTVCAVLAALPCGREVGTRIGREERKLAEVILEMHAKAIKSDNYPFPTGKV